MDRKRFWSLGGNVLAELPSHAGPRTCLKAVALAVGVRPEQVHIRIRPDGDSDVFVTSTMKLTCTACSAPIECSCAPGRLHERRPACECVLAEDALQDMCTGCYVAAELADHWCTSPDCHLCNETPEISSRTRRTRPSRPRLPHLPTEKASSRAFAPACP